MELPFLPTPSSQPTQCRTFRRWKASLLSSPLRSGAIFGTFIFATLVAYTTFLSPHGPLWRRPTDWHGFSDPGLNPSSSLSEPTTTTETPHPSPSPSPSPISDVLTVEQIRDIVAPTRGFFTRDYSLGLGWNNVSVCVVPFNQTEHPSTGALYP